MDFDLELIKERIKDPLFSDNLTITLEEILEEQLNAKIEAQKWCLGIHTGLLNYAAEVEGVLQTTDGLQGTVTSSPVNYQGKEAWIPIAMGELGVKEIKGAGSNSRIGEYLKTVGHAPNDDIAWCSAFANWVMIKAGYTGTKGLLPGAAFARSWLNWGREATPGTVGAIVVFSRGPFPRGHVGFCVGFDGKTIKLLGGNQSNAVTIANYSLKNVLGWRLP